MSGLTLAAALAVVQACAPNVAPGTMLPVLMGESGFHPDAVNVNRNGTIDLGIAQINSTNWRRLGLTAETALDPCRSVAAAQRVLIENYHPANGTPEAQQAALRVTLAAYNAGPLGGKNPAYVHRIEQVAAQLIPELRVEGVPPSPAPLSAPSKAIADDPNDPRPPDADMEAVADWLDRHAPKPDNTDKDSP